MVALRPGTARCRLLQARVCGLVTAIGLLLVACTSAHPARPASDAAPTAAATASASSAGSPSGAASADCDSVATCYTPQQLQVAYGVKPLLDRGIDGRGETVVLPELAESALNPPLVTDMRQDMAAFDARSACLPRGCGSTASLVRTRHPWLAFGEEVLDVEMVHALAPGATLVILLLPTNSLDNTANTVAAAVALAAPRQRRRRRHVDQRRRPDRRRALREPRAGRQRERRAADGREPARDGGRRLRRHRGGGRAVRCLRGAGRRRHASPRSRRSTCSPPTRWCSAPAAPA